MEKRRFSLQVSLVTMCLMLLGACGVIDLQKPKVQVTSAQYQRLSLKTGRLNTRLSVTNPNNFTLPIKALSYQLYLNDKEFLSGNTSKGLELAAAETRQIDLPIDISYQKLLDSLGSAVAMGRIRYQLRGEFDFGLLSVPYQQSGEFKLY
jgi:LEA14-like dessication related protein